MIASEEPGKLITKVTMKKILTSIILCFVAIAASAQQKADIEVSYTAHRPNPRNGKDDVTDQYILLANTTESKFYSPLTEYIDSLNSSPEGKAKLNEMTRAAFTSGNLDDIPTVDGSFYVVKSITESKLRHYDHGRLEEKFVYEEPITPWDWEITVDSTKTVLGYECIMASTDYHGRKWTVWFASEIPVQNGPWKLDGLPGLILYAEAEGGQYSFVVTGIQQTDKIIGPVYLADDYEATTRKEYLKAERDFLDNPLGKINAKFAGHGTISVSSSDGKDINSLFVPASVVDFLETDYR